MASDWFAPSVDSDRALVSWRSPSALDDLTSLLDDRTIQVLVTFAGISRDDRRSGVRSLAEHGVGLRRATRGERRSMNVWLPLRGRLVMLLWLPVLLPLELVERARGRRGEPFVAERAAA